MNGNKRIYVEGDSNGTDGKLVQTIAQVADGASSWSPGGVSNGGPCPAFLKFLKCDVAVDNLMKFLKVEEMKDLCLVSKDMLAAVMRTREFPKRSQFTIKKNLIKKLDLAASEVDLHNRFPFSWKHIAFDVSLPMQVVNQFADKLKCVESLKLYYKSTDRDLSERSKLSSKSAVECCIKIHVILSMAVNLRELEMDLLFLHYPLNETFSNWEVQQSMSKLESLIVYGMDVRVRRLHSAQFQQNLLQLSRCPLPKIKTLSMENTFQSKELNCIAEFVKAFKETLEVLDLNQSIWSLEKMRAIQLPKLRQLTVGMSEKDLDDVAAFVEKQPVLEELYLDVHTEEPPKDLKCLQGRLLNLRKFRYFVDQVLSTEEETGFDWSFLEAMTKLEEFTVRLHHDGRGPEMIDHIPDKVEKLSISCQFRGADFWSSRRQLEGFSSNVGNHLKRLKNLTHLSLIECSDAVTDVGLQTIIKNFPHLIQLKLRDCPNLTDFGISGMNEDELVEELEPRVPLSDLKGLVELEISHCDLVTTACVLAVVRFKGLRRFTFNTSDGNEDTVQFASQIRKENPRLTFLQHNCHTWERNGLVWTHSDDDDDDDDEED